MPEWAPGDRSPNMGLTSDVGHGAFLYRPYLPNNGNFLMNEDSMIFGKHDPNWIG